MRCNTIRAALLIGIVALATEVGAAGPTAADAAKIKVVLDRWQVVEAGKGGDVALWRDMMGVQLKMVSPSTLDALLALNTGPNAQTAAEFYQSFIHILGSDITARLQAQKKRAQPAAKVSEAPAAGRVEPKTLGAVGIDQTFTPITPCRVVDTRLVGGPIAAFATRNFFYFTTGASTNWNSLQGGVNGAAGTVCPGTVISTFNPSAAVATVIVTGQGGGGNLIVWQGTSPVAAADTLSYPAAGDTSTLTDIPWGGRSGTGPGGAVEDFGVFVNAFTPTNVVVDIVGYYTQPAATALDCTSVNVAGTGTVANGSTFFLSVPACSAGYTRTASGCYQDTVLANFNLSDVSPIHYNDCIWENQTGATQNGSNFHAESVCCRVPGH